MRAQRAPPGGPYAPIVLLLPAGARTLAMGNTGVAGRDDDVLFFNPAQMAIARGFSASAERYSPTSAGDALSSVTRFSTGGIALGMRMVDYELPPNVFPGDRGTMLGRRPGARDVARGRPSASRRSSRALRIGGAVEVRRGQRAGAPRGTRARSTRRRRKTCSDTTRLGWRCRTSARR